MPPMGLQVLLHREVHMNVFHRSDQPGIGGNASTILASNNGARGIDGIDGGIGSRSG